MTITITIGDTTIALDPKLYRCLRAHLRDCDVSQLRALGLLLPKIEAPR